MIAYKATYNYKCLGQEYKVGKVYTSDKMKLCSYGIHFCPIMDDVLLYYSTGREFVLLEIEVLGQVDMDEDAVKGVKRKGVTDKIKVRRVVPREEYSDEMKKQFPVYEYGPHGEILTVTYSNGDVHRFEYDSEGNMVSKVGPRDSYRYEYDSKGRVVSVVRPGNRSYVLEYDSEGHVVSQIHSDGAFFKWEYDSRGNLVSESRPSVFGTGLFETRHEYDSNGNLTATIRPNNMTYRYGYDSENRRISETLPNGRVIRFEHATITESDS